MRLRIILLVVAASSLVLVSFLVPLALVLRTLAADRAVSAATVQAQWMAPVVATLRTDYPRLATAVNAQTSPVTVFLPNGTSLGTPAPRDAAVRLAARGRSFTTVAPGGVEVLVAVGGLPGGGRSAVIRTFVADDQLRHGVTRAWLLLGCVGLGLLALSVVVADQLARSLVRPLTGVAQASDRLANGDLSARAELAGPPEVRRAGAGLNRLARRIGDLLAHERETIADVSHRLRTPMTALRIDAESLGDQAERTQVLADLDALERTVDQVIREARRPAPDSRGACDAAAVVAQRTAYWLPLAEDTDRAMTIELASGELPVRVSGEDLAACMDILLENAFAHTPDGTGLAIRLTRRAAGGAWLVVADDGPGFRSPHPTERGQSSGGSTGLGLDIARRIAESSGGTLTIGGSVSGGGSVTVGLGPVAGPANGHAATGAPGTGCPPPSQCRISGRRVSRPPPAGSSAP
jgi:signal transduction histidine kinase